MNFIKNIIEYIKKKIIKKDSTILLDEPLNIENSVENNGKKEKFKEELIVKIRESKNKKLKVETLVCNGDGLGIQSKITY